MVPTLPIGWSDQGTRGPMTLIGMREWQDIQAGKLDRLEMLSAFRTSCLLLSILSVCHRSRWILSCPWLTVPLQAWLRLAHLMHSLLTSRTSSAWVLRRVAWPATLHRLRCTAAATLPEVMHQLQMPVVRRVVH